MMPDTYRVKLSDGREFNVTTEGGPPSEADVLGSLKQPSDIALTIGGGSVAPPIMTPTGPAGFSHLSDAPDEAASTRAKLFDALDRHALPRSGTDLAGLFLQGDAGLALTDRIVAPVVGAVGRYGGAATDLLSSLLPAKVKAPLAILRELNPADWNSPFTVAGREARRLSAHFEDIASQAAKVVDRFMPNRSGVPDAGLPQGPLPRVPPSPVDRFMPNRGGVPDAGVPPGQLAPPAPPPLDRYMPNRSGVIDAGIPHGPLAQPGLDRYMPNRSGVAPVSGIIAPPVPAVPTPVTAAVIPAPLQAAMQRVVAKLGPDKTRALLAALDKGLPDLTPPEIAHSLALAETGLSPAKILAAVKAARPFPISSVLPK